MGVADFLALLEEYVALDLPSTVYGTLDTCFHSFGHILKPRSISRFLTPLCRFTQGDGFIVSVSVGKTRWFTQNYEVSLDVKYAHYTPE